MLVELDLSHSETVDSMSAESELLAVQSDAMQAATVSTVPLDSMEENPGWQLAESCSQSVE